MNEGGSDSSSSLTLAIVFLDDTRLISGCGGVPRHDLIDSSLMAKEEHLFMCLAPFAHLLGRSHLFRDIVHVETR